MSKLIRKNKNGSFYVENDNGEIFCIVDSNTIADVEGFLFKDHPLKVLESNGFTINQDFDNETSYIEFSEGNGESYKLCFSGSEVTIED